MSIQKFVSFCAIFIFFALGQHSCKIDNNKRPNLLFIAVDDLRPELASLGKEYMITPNMDRLASAGVLFANHYANVPTCGASRYTLLTGMLPRKPSDVGNGAIQNALSGKPEKESPETFIHHLKRNGYHTIGIGKISHSADGFLYGYNDSVTDIRELPYSWDELVFDNDKWGTGWNAFFGYADGSNRQSMKRQVKPYEAAVVGDEGYPDGIIANLAIEKLRERSKVLVENPDSLFVLAVGFFKPHLPFNSPRNYWDNYEQSTIPLPPSRDLPLNTNPQSLHGSGEFNQYQLGEEKASLNENMSDDYTKKIRQAYFAAVSYTDAQIGKLLNELEQLGLSENTAVVVWGDHGWHLGDHRVWGKHSLSEYALRSAFILKVPGKKRFENLVCETPVSSIDIYPTIMDMCNIEMPHKTDGISLIPLLDGGEKFNNQAFGYWKSGVTVRTDRYRLTKYFDNARIELFDYQRDPYEEINIADLEKHLVDSLSMIWEKGNTGVFK